MDQKDEEKINPDILQQIIQSIASIKYGTVEIVVHDGNIVQIQKVEKIRLDAKK